MRLTALIPHLTQLPRTLYFVLCICVRKSRFLVNVNSYGIPLLPLLGHEHSKGPQADGVQQSIWTVQHESLISITGPRLPLL